MFNLSTQYNTILHSMDFRVGQKFLLSVYVQGHMCTHSYGGQVNLRCLYSGAIHLIF